jgi:hypothetical protein
LYIVAILILKDMMLETMLKVSALMNAVLDLLQTGYSN